MSFISEIRDIQRKHFDFEDWISELRGNVITTEQFYRVVETARIAAMQAVTGVRNETTSNKQDIGE